MRRAFYVLLLVGLWLPACSQADNSGDVLARTNSQPSTATRFPMLPLTRGVRRKFYRALSRLAEMAVVAENPIRHIRFGTTG